MGQYITFIIIIAIEDLRKKLREEILKKKVDMEALKQLESQRKVENDNLRIELKKNEAKHRIQLEAEVEKRKRLEALKEEQENQRIESEKKQLLPLLLNSWTSDLRPRAP